MECLNCKAAVPQTPKKRPKLYCSEKCRIEFFRKKRPKGKPGRPKKKISDPAREKAKTINSSPKVDTSHSTSKENTQSQIAAMIAAIKAEKIPKERDISLIGRKSWALDQKKRIQELEKMLVQ